MRALFILVVLIGGPIAIWNQLTSGHPDWGAVGVMALFVLGAIGGLYVLIDKNRQAQGQRAFWLNQRRK